MIVFAASAGDETGHVNWMRAFNIKIFGFDCSTFR